MDKHIFFSYLPEDSDWVHILANELDGQHYVTSERILSHNEVRNARHVQDYTVFIAVISPRFLDKESYTYEQIIEAIDKKKPIIAVFPTPNKEENLLDALLEKANMQCVKIRFRDSDKIETQRETLRQLNQELGKAGAHPLLLNEWNKLIQTYPERFSFEPRVQSPDETQPDVPDGRGNKAGSLSVPIMTGIGLVAIVIIAGLIFFFTRGYNPNPIDEAPSETDAAVIETDEAPSETEAVVVETDIVPTVPAEEVVEMIPTLAPGEREALGSSLPDASGEIIFNSRESTTVYSFDVDTRTVLPILRAVESTIAPSRPLNGDTLTYGWLRNDNFDIWIQSDNNQIRNISNNAETDDFAPSWSPDGTQIVYVSRRANGSNDLMIATLIDTEIELSAILSDARAINSPVWSPDGQYIAFEMINTVGGSSKGIYVLTRSNNELNLLTPDNIIASSPAWSSDNQSLAYIVETGSNAEIHLMNINTGQDEVLPGPQGINPLQVTWSPDGNYLAFLAETNGLSQIFIVDQYGGFTEQVTNENTVIDDLHWTN